LEVCADSTFTETGPIIYRASGEVGGQIQINREQSTVARTRSRRPTGTGSRASPYYSLTLGRFTL
jgi:hypothetical protein